MHISEYNRLLRQMKIEERMKDLGQWLIDNPHCSIRELADEFMLSPSQVHRDLNNLRHVDLEMYDQVITILKRKNTHSLSYQKKY